MDNSIMDTGATIWRLNIKSRSGWITAAAVAGLFVLSSYLIRLPLAESSVPEGQVLYPVYRMPAKTLFPIVQNRATVPAIPPALTFVAASTLREVTAYNAGDVAQCDLDPCISANGEDICLALERGLKRCAANFVPLGTRLWVDGVGECLVTDRMNRRFRHRVDIAMPLAEKRRAKAFGLKRLEVKVLSHM